MWTWSHYNTGYIYFYSLRELIFLNLKLAKTTKMVLAIDNQFDLLQQCAENVSSYIHEKSINVEYLCSDFL